MTKIEKAALELAVANFASMISPEATAPMAARGAIGDKIAQAPARSRADVIAKLEAALSYASDPDRFEEEACLDILLSAARDWQDLAEARMAA